MAYLLRNITIHFLGCCDSHLVDIVNANVNVVTTLFYFFDVVAVDARVRDTFHLDCYWLCVFIFNSLVMERLMVDNWSYTDAMLQRQLLAGSLSADGAVDLWTKKRWLFIAHEKLPTEHWYVVMVDFELECIASINSVASERDQAVRRVQLLIHHHSLASGFDAS